MVDLNAPREFRALQPFQLRHRPIILGDPVVGLVEGAPAAGDQTLNTDGLGGADGAGSGDEEVAVVGV
ncbi:MAG: hypothetical protein ACYDAR_11375, partial [Thermomicrobiales bacterium]